ncbi:MAG: OmpA/MotB family protein [Desulfovibrio sp.]|uniref:OmpA/MotB family protein n=1 Tax=Desulfovibrio sp. 7SRBS1 TaxID=3378064 RepID=UPI003B415D30
MNNDLFPFKKKQHDEDEGWALTLADMMTLLLCFFVLILAISEVDKHKYSTVAQSLSDAMGGKAEQQAPPTASSLTMSVAPARNLFEVQLELARELKLDSDTVRLTMRPDAVAIELKGAVFFLSGSAELTPRALSVMRKIAAPLVQNAGEYDYIVEGHTDDVPMHSARFPSNWELSSARASAVARRLIDDGLPKNKVKVMGLADTRPVVPNLTSSGEPIPENRSRNRRVVILVKPVNDNS